MAHKGRIVAELILAMPKENDVMVVPRRIDNRLKLPLARYLDLPNNVSLKVLTWRTIRRGNRGNGKGCKVDTEAKGFA